MLQNIIIAIAILAGGYYAIKGNFRDSAFIILACCAALLLLQRL